MTKTEHRHTSHWGTFTAEAENGRLTGVQPFPLDPDPSPIIQSLPEAVHDESRVARPMFRKGWLDRAQNGSPENRGIDPFVAVAPVGLSAPNSNHTHSLTDATEGDYNTTMYFYVNYVSGRSGERACRLHSSAS